MLNLRLRNRSFKTSQADGATQKRSWITGNAEAIDLRFPVELVREWNKTIPNPGVIRYYVLGNWERVVVLSPKAIADLLVNKSYDFIRPEIASIQLAKVTGHGLLVAEGDTHKVNQTEFKTKSK